MKAKKEPTIRAKRADAAGDAESQRDGPNHRSLSHIAPAKDLCMARRLRAGFARLRDLADDRKHGTTRSRRWRESRRPRRVADPPIDCTLVNRNTTAIAPRLNEHEPKVVEQWG